MVTANTLTYTIRPENATSIELPDEFGQSVMVNDELSADIYIKIKNKMKHDTLGFLVFSFWYSQ